MQQLMIMVTEVGKLEHTCNLLAEVNKGEIVWSQEDIKRWGELV